MESAIYQNKPIETVGKEWTWNLRIDGDGFDFDCDDPDEKYNPTHFPNGYSCCVASCCVQSWTNADLRDIKSQTIATFFTDMDSNYDPEKTIVEWQNGETKYHTFGYKVLDVQIRAVFSKHVR